MKEPRFSALYFGHWVSFLYLAHADYLNCLLLSVGNVAAEKPEEPSRYRRKNKLRQLFNANKNNNNDDASN